MRYTVSFFFFLASLQIAAQLKIVPAPAVEGFYDAPDLQLMNTVGFKGDIPENCKNYLVEQFAELYGITLTPSGQEPVFVFSQTASEQLDFYRIDIENGKEVHIEYTTGASCFYALSSLLQLVKEHNGKQALPSVHIEDYLRFSWRGMHLDVSRHFFTVEEVKRCIDLMAFYKFNTFHWHLTDDQGWRIEIKKYPRLTSVGGWRDSTVNAHYTTVPRTYTVERYGGFYTQDEIREVVAYAASKYITVVPEIEMPGHARAALSAYPELSCTGVRQGAEGLWGVFDDIFCTKDETVSFLQDVLDEVLELFPSEYIHIGGDEAPKTRWKECPDCQRNIRKHKLKDEHELQSWFISQMDAYLTARGRKLIGWDEILEGGLSENAAVMSWQGFEGGREAAMLHHEVVMSPGSHCYFDHYQSKNAAEPLAFGGYTPIEKVYAFEPVPTGLGEKEQKYILGAQANLWTEYIPVFKQVEYMAYPRALALAQVVWCTDKPEWEVFRNSLIEKQFPLLDEMKVNYSKALLQPRMQITPLEKGIRLHWSSAVERDSFKLYYGNEKVQLETILKNDGFLDIHPMTSPDWMKIQLRSLITGFETNYTLIRHSALGLPVELHPAPHPRFTNQGGLTLVDGFRGSKPWKGNEWLGFDTSELEIIIDLQEVRYLHKIEIGCLEDISSWIRYPERIEISSAREKGNWSKTKEYNFNPEMKYVFEDQGRFIRIRIFSGLRIPEDEPGAGNVPWTFLDEIIIE